MVRTQGYSYDRVSIWGLALGYDTTLEAVLANAQKLTQVSLMYRQGDGYDRGVNVRFEGRYPGLGANTVYSAAAVGRVSPKPVVSPAAPSVDEQAKTVDSNGDGE